jgi:hypothetical protein
MKQLSTRIALAIGAFCSLAAVTAFGVAPLSSPPLPPMAIVLDPVAIEPQILEVQDGFPQSESIRRGETLGSLLARLGADDPEFAAFVKRDPIARKLLQLQSGRTFTTTLAADGTILRLAYRLRNPEAARPGRRLVIERNGAAIVALEEDVAFERQIEMRSAEILTSLFAATDAAGIPDAVASRVADVFDADIDFNRDLRRGDRLRVIYETLRRTRRAPATSIRSTAAACGARCCARRWSSAA